MKFEVRNLNGSWHVGFYNLRKIWVSLQVFGTQDRANQECLKFIGRNSSFNK